MKYSVAELSYVRTSLLSTPPIRPDSRLPDQVRPFDSQVDVLPTTNGSACVRASDGSECIVGIKSKVVLSHEDLVQVSVDIAGFKDNDPFPTTLAGTIREALAACPELFEGLILTPKYAFRLFVDCVVFSYNAQPLGLLSMAVFQALKATRLPVMLADQANIEDAVVDEIPQFNDDWSAAKPLCSTWTPPVLFVVAIVGENVFVDPTEAEIQVSEAVLCITWKHGVVAAPIRTVDISPGPYVGAFASSNVLAAYDLVDQCGPNMVGTLSS